MSRKPFTFYRNGNKNRVLDWLLSLQWAGLMPGTLLHMMVIGKMGLRDLNCPVILVKRIS